MEALENRARKTYPKLLRAQQELGFPAFECIPECPLDPMNKGRYLYEPAAWGFKRKVDGNAVQPPLRKRMRKKGPDSAAPCAHSVS